MFDYPSFMIGVYGTLLIHSCVFLIQMVISNKKYKKNMIKINEDHKKRMKEIDDKYNKKDV